MMYSVMQSDGNSFCGDVVSDSFNKTSWDEDNILAQICEIKYVWIIIMMILILYNIIRKCILYNTVALNPILWAPCCYGLYFCKHTFSSITLNIYKFHNKYTKKFAFHSFVLECCLHHCKPCWSFPRWHLRIKCSHLIASHCILNLRNFKPDQFVKFCFPFLSH